MPLLLQSRRARLLASIALCALPIIPAYADDAVTAPVQQIVVTGQNSAVPDNVPAVVEGFSNTEIKQSVNAVTAAETIKYLPSIEVRERYIGDRNAIVETRTTGTVASAESMVYADGTLLSNLLGNSYSYPPRWGMVSPEEIERVDVMYGPFSALYPGNSLGGVVTMTTRTPDRAEAHADFKSFVEHFKLYGTSETNPGGDASASLANRVGNLSYWLSFDHLDAFGHPMSFATADCASNCNHGATNVTGYYVDTDPTNGQRRYVFGAYSIDHTIQDSGKLKLAYDFTPEVKMTYTLGLWSDDSKTQAQSYLTSATTGQPVYGGTVTIGGNNYTVSGLGPSNTSEFHMLNSLQLKSDSRGLWDGEADLSKYSYLKEQARSNTNYTTNAGTDQKQNGTGWETGELRGIYRPTDALGGKHEVTLGYHYDHYLLDQYTFNTTNWSSGSDSSFNSSSVGQTQTQAVYLQDAYRFLPQWTLTLGARDEYWDAYNGANQKSSGGPVNYTNRSQNNISPKASIAYEVTPQLTERFSYGQAYRYPTVTELYQAVTSGSALIQNNPNLKPEEVKSFDWSSEYSVGKNSARISLFQEDLHNALVSQTDQSVNLTQTENVNKVRMQGVELASRTSDLLFQGFDLMGSLTYTNAIILDDQQYTAANGKEFPRIPKWRATLLGVYHQNEDLTYSLGMRYAGHTHSSLNNADISNDTYGAISPYFVVDSRVSYKLRDGVTAALGVDNMTNDKYFVSPHPFSQITVFSELKFDY